MTTVEGTVPIGPVLGEHAASIRDVGVLTAVDDEELRGEIEVREEMFLPGSAVVRPSILATMADIVCGKFANASTQPRICVTLDLDLHLTRDPHGAGFEPGDRLECRAKVVRAGRRIVVTGFELDAPGVGAFGFGHAGFMASPDPVHVNPDGFPLDSDEPRAQLHRPFAERAGVTVDDAGRALLPFRLENVNATGALQGGLLVLAAEEALRSVRDDSVMRSVAVRYLRAFRQVDALAGADIRGDVARVELLDARDGHVGATIVAHLRPAAIDRGAPR